MKPIKWLLQKNLLKASFLKRFEKALINEQVAYELIQVIPFSREAPSIDTHHYHIFYGSTTLMINAYRSYPQQGIFYDEATFSMALYQQKWGEYLLNHDGKCSTLHTLSQTTLPPNQTFFIRPNDDSKSFSGRIISFAQLQQWTQRLQEDLDNDISYSLLHQTIWYAQPKEIYAEYRHFIVDQQIILMEDIANKTILTSGNLYQQLSSFVHDRIATFTPHDIFVIDIAQTPQGLKILECGCINGTGFYTGAVEVVIKAIHHHFASKISQNYT